MDARARKGVEQGIEDPVLVPPHARGVERHHERFTKSVHDEARKPVALGMDDAPGIAHAIEPEQIAPQVNRVGDPAAEEVGIDRLILALGEEPHRHRCLAIPEPAADEGVIRAAQLHEATRGDARGRPLDRTLKDERMVVGALAAQMDDGKPEGVGGGSGRGAGASAHAPMLAGTRRGANGVIKLPARKS